MINLAGVKNCDSYIREELTRCGIEIVESAQPCGLEVNARLSGKLGPFTFTRAWYYWVVKGKMPLSSARKLYTDPAGRTDIRVAGHCACPPPEEWARYEDAQRRLLASDPEGKQRKVWAEASEVLPEAFAKAEEPIWVPNAADVAAYAYVESYHVDSELGLFLLAEEIRRLHGILRPGL